MTALAVFAAAGTALVACPQTLRPLADDPCDAGAQCELDGGRGVLACDGGAHACIPVTCYQDADRDGHGDPSVPFTPCPTDKGTAERPTDCDDGDPFAHPGAPEICDGRDSDCNRAVDDGPRCADAGWSTNESLPIDDGYFWYTAASWRRGAVWVAGNDSRVWMRDGQRFVSFDGDCSGAWRASWVARDGTVYLGGIKVPLSKHEPADGGCQDLITQLAGYTVWGLHGFATHDGGVDLFGATDEGWLFRWTNGELTDAGFFPDSRLAHVHGVSPGFLVLVGQHASTSRGRAWIFDGTRWTEQGDITDAGVQSWLNKAYVVSPSLAYVVGDERSAFVYDGARWTALPDPQPGQSFTFASVVAFGRSQVFTVDSLGWVRRFDGSRWTELTLSPRGGLWDIAAKAPDDIWAVGQNGAILHWYARP